MRRIPILILFALLLLAASACTTNPVTGERQFSVVSDAQAAQLGAQENKNVVEEFGVYDELPELSATVDRIGRKIAAVSDRPDLPWSFTILDTPMINAMALPGGYIYVTRGILERMNTEDELAGVIGHEIGHVAAKHAEARISQAQLAQLGLVLGAVVAGPAATQAYGGLAQLGTQLLFQRYSREQESQADLLGTAYMTEAGFNPEGAKNMLLVLKRLDRGELGAIDRYFIDHPDPAKRVKDVESKISSLGQRAPSILDRPMDRDSFVRRLRSMIVGPSTLQTTITADTIYERRYGMILPIPNGWTATAAPGAIFVAGPEKSSNVGLIAQDIPLKELQGARSVQDAVRTLLQREGLQYVTSTNAASRTGERFAIDLWRGRTQSGTVIVESTEFTGGDRAVVLLYIAPGLQNGRSALSDILGTLSFDRNRARRIEPPRMKLGTAAGDRTWSRIAQRATGQAKDAPTVAHINGFDEDNPVPSTTLLKLPQAVAGSR